MPHTSWIPDLRSPLGLFLYGLCFCMLATTHAHAQESIATDEHSAVSYHPAPGGNNYLMVEGTQVGGFASPIFGLHLDYAFTPLDVLTQCEGRAEIDCGVTGEEVAIVKSLLAVHLTAALTFMERFEVGVDLPLLYASGDGMPFRVGGAVNNDIQGGSGFGLGDVRLQGKAQILGAPASGYALSAKIWGAVPTGQATAEGRFVGDSFPAFGGGAIGEMWRGPLRGAINLGGFYRPSGAVVATEVSAMMTYAAALEYAFPFASVLAELTGATAFKGQDELLETRLAGRFRVGAFEFDAGAGVGILLGPGTPDLRLLAGARYAPVPSVDADGDGVMDEDDLCPVTAEDMDGFADDDGCPEADNDTDGVPDGEDQCPNEPEDLDQHEDEDGCPDPDNDGDGVRDGYDSCPDTPEDMDGDRDDDGCPDHDSDRDGVDDARDQCPDQREDTDGLADLDGCPEDDADGDGIPDERDECPEEPEDRDRFQDRDGCPDEGGRIRARRRPEPPPPASPREGASGAGAAVSGEGRTAGDN